MQSNAAKLGDRGWRRSPSSWSCSSCSRATATTAHRPRPRPRRRRPADELGVGRGQAVRSPRSRSRTAQPVGGIQDLTFTEGDDIRFKVDSDVSDEVHFHGYDVGEDVKAGGSVEFDVPATITGVFEVELESAREQIAEITVNPS